MVELTERFNIAIKSLKYSGYYITYCTHCILQDVKNCKNANTLHKSGNERGSKIRVGIMEFRHIAKCQQFTLLKVLLCKSITCEDVYVQL